MPQKIDIFKGKEKELEKKFESEGYDWEKIKKNLEKIAKKEEVDKKLSELEGNIDAHYIYLKSLISDLEKFKKESGIVDKAKQKAKEEFKKKKEEGFSKLRKIADKAIPFGIGGAIFDWAKELIDGSDPKEDDGFFSKISKSIGAKIGFAVLGMFGLKKGYDSWKNMNTEGLQNETSREEQTVNGESDNSKQIGKTKLKKEKLDSLEQNKKSKEFYYYSGMKTLSYFSGLHDIPNSVFKSIKDYEFGDLVNKNKDVLGKDTENNSVVEKFEEVKNHFVGEKSENTKIILKASLKKEKIKVIIDKNRGFLEKKLSLDGLNGLKNKLEKEDFSYNKLTFNEISILLFAGFNTLGILGFEQVKQGFGSVTNFIETNNNLEFIDDVKDDLIGKRKGLISDEIIAGFFSLGDSGQSFMGSYNLIKEKFQNPEYSPKKQKEINEKLKEIVHFKDWLLNGFLQEDKNLLKELGYDNDFKENLDYRGVLLLYLALSGEKTMDNVSVFDYPVIYKILSWIIGKNNPGRGSAYLSSVGLNFFRDNDKKIFSKDENEALKVVGVSLGLSLLDRSVRGLKEKLGFSQILFNDNIVGSSATIGTGLVMFKYAGRFIPQFRLIGILTTLVGGLSLFTDLYSKSSSLLDDLRGLVEPIKNNKKEIDLEDYIEKIDKFSEKIVEDEIEINGKKEKVSLYPGKKGLEIIFNGEIYRLDIGPNPGNVYVDKKRSDLPLFGVEKQLPDTRIVDFNVGKYHGKIVDFSKVELSGDKIIFGKDGKQIEYPKEKIFDSIKKGEIKYPLKLFDKKDYGEVEYLLVEELTRDLPSFLDGIEKRIRNDIILTKVGKVETKLET